MFLKCINFLHTNLNYLKFVDEILGMSIVIFSPQMYMFEKTFWLRLKGQITELGQNVAHRTRASAFPFFTVTLPCKLVMYSALMEPAGKTPAAFRISLIAILCKTISDPLWTMSNPYYPIPIWGTLLVMLSWTRELEPANGNYPQGSASTIPPFPPSHHPCLAWARWRPPPQPRMGQLIKTVLDRPLQQTDVDVPRCSWNLAKLAFQA